MDRIEQYEIGTMLFDHCATFIRKYKEVPIDEDLELSLLKNVLQINEDVIKSYTTKSLLSNVNYTMLKIANEEMTNLKENHSLIKSRLSLLQG